MKVPVRVALLGLITVLSASMAHGQGFTPGEARARMTVPDGFRVELFASEPEVRQPVAACFDERGRLWVIEYLQYPNPAGLKPLEVDQYLRTKYDRVPDPPPKGPLGADRIKILEDTDGDGRADKVTTFLEGLNLATALAVGHGGVFVGQAPYLLFYPDRNRDGVPDGDPEVLLSGFGIEDAHATVNSLAWGPDGWLYGVQGSTVTAKIRGVEFQQGVWRYEPRSRRFELFAEGGGNTWGLDFDRAGHAFGSSNGGFVAFHMVQGGYYWKGFSKHGPLHNPRTYGYFDALPYEGTKVGGHVTPGGIIYKGDMFPESFRNTFIGGNLLSNAVYWHVLTPRGSSFGARHGGTLLDANDRWFRPIDLLTGPDGAVYLVDWYDKRASHLDPRDTWDKTNGRIYRIAYGPPRKIEPFDLSTWPSEKLVDLRTHANDWWPETARRILAERRDPSVAAILKGLLREDRDEAAAMRDLWTLDVSGGLDAATALELVGHDVPGVRRWVVRRLGDDGDPASTELRNRLLALAETESDPTVRSQIASSARRWPAGFGLDLVERLLGREADASDPHLPLLTWWAIEGHLDETPDRVVELVADSRHLTRPTVRGHLLERVARALAAAGEAGQLERCGTLLTAATRAGVGDRVLAGMDQGLEGQGASACPPALASALRAAFDGPDPGFRALRLGVRLGVAGSKDRAITALEGAKSPEDRLALLVIIGLRREEEGLEILLREWDRPEAPAAVRMGLLATLGAFDRPQIAARLLDDYEAAPAGVRERMLGLLASRPAWAGQLLDAIEEGRVSARDLKPAQAQQIVRLGQSDLSERLRRAWGQLPGSGSEAKRQRIAEIRGVLPEGDKGVATRGRAVFTQHCATCHKLFGEGEAIGPDLTGADRGDLEFLLASVVDPSSLIRKEYEAQTIALGDGRVVTGLVVEETPTSLTLVDGQRQKVVLPVAEVEERRPADASLMPEGLLDPLSEDQVRDLFRYLQSAGAGGK